MAPKESEKTIEEIADSPVLLVGAPRSGTSWLQNMLLSHPACCGGQESHLLASMAHLQRDFERKAGFTRPHGVAAYLTRTEFINALRDMWRTTFRGTIEQSPGAGVLIEKTPDHALHLDLAREILPHCKVIHLVRDSRSVMASLIRASRSEWGRDWAPGSVDSAAARWIECVESAEAEGRMLGPDRFMRVHYEELHRNPLATIGRILDFIRIQADRSLINTMIEGQSIEVTRQQRKTPVKLRGHLAGEDEREPEGFIGEGRIDGWQEELGRRGSSKAWKLTSGLMKRMGYDESGLTDSPRGSGS